jgi:hypothetical protein
VHITEPRSWRSQRGATLLETVVAVGLFALTAATMGDFLTQQIRTGGANANYSTAYALAAEEFEDIRALPFDEIVSRTSSLSQGTMTFDVDTAVADDTPSANMKQITVNVNWNEPGGPQHVTVLSIYTEVRR